MSISMEVWVISAAVIFATAFVFRSNEGTET